MAAFRGPAPSSGRALVDSLTASAAAARALRSAIDLLAVDAAAAHECIAGALARHRTEIAHALDFAAFTGPRLLSDALVLDGRPTQRLQVRRLMIGDPIARPFGRSLGVTECASTAPDVRALWTRLLGLESASDDVLHGRPSTVLDVPDAVVSIEGGRFLHVSLRDNRSAPQSWPCVVVPRFAHAAPARKLNNFGHWLLDCAPQLLVLSEAAPDGVFLVPQPLKPFQRWSVLQIGLHPDRFVPWDGAPIRGGRVVVFESDGRSGGGRPLSAMLRLRERLRAGAVATGTPSRRIYVSRRDARTKRRWVNNQAAVEDLFRSRGFEVISMADYPLDEQASTFRDAHIVAGISGAGLTDLVFSAPGTHSIVLLSDSLVRWYADQRGARSLWARGMRGGSGRLAALGDSPRFYTHLAAAFDQISHSFLAADEMPLDELARFLDRVLARVTTR
jgi:capsular polysaccharide biosynthesis protein